MIIIPTFSRLGGSDPLMPSYLVAEPEREVESLSSSFRFFPLDFTVFSILVKCTQKKKKNHLWGRTLQNSDS